MANPALNYYTGTEGSIKFQGHRNSSCIFTKCHYTDHGSQNSREPHNFEQIDIVMQSDKWMHGIYPINKHPAILI